MTFKPLLLLALFFSAGIALGQGDNSRILHGDIQFNDSTTQTTAATAPAIGSAITGGTTCSVLFIGAGPVLAQDNSAFCWDATNHRLGIGTTTPANPLSVVGVIQSTTGGFKFPDNTTQTTAAAAPAIGGAITGGTTCSVLFIGAGPVLAQDHSAFCWDVTNHRLGIGTTTPAVALDVNGMADFRALVLFSDTIGSAMGTWDINASNGFYTTASFGAFKWAGNTGFFRDAADAVSQRDSTSAQAFFPYNTFTDTSNYERGGFDWQTTPNVMRIETQAAGTGVLRDMALMGGNVGVGGTAPNAKFDVTGNSVFDSIGKGPTTHTTLSGDIDDVVTTIPVVDTTGYPNHGTIVIKAEEISYSNVDATDFLGCTRGAYGTTAASHSSGDEAPGVTLLVTGSDPSSLVTVTSDGQVGFGHPDPTFFDVNSTYFPVAVDQRAEDGAYLMVNADSNHVGEFMAADTGVDNRLLVLLTQETTATNPALYVSYAGTSDGVYVVSGGVPGSNAIHTAGGEIKQEGVVRGAAGVANGVSLSPTLTASADSDLMTGLRVAPAWDDAGHTGTAHVTASFLNGFVGIGTATPAASLDMGNNPTAIRLGGAGQIFGIAINSDYLDLFNATWGTPGGGHIFADTTGSASWVGPVAAGTSDAVLKNDGGGNSSWSQSAITTATASAGTCSATCSSGRAKGGGCAHSAALSLQNSFPSSVTAWSCDYLAYSTGTCTAYVICE